ncbi:hypothetical protein [Fundicoccus culcitae]|uniref:Uncharacterized protein n=1 Tax=Fundicoccus culcitae TaxID=2969821 RepID=A0ABY5P234_9LACT|nr:hypothetical protein [Fundicoccus culcitae]UUX32767.1 hypothetical protein NRE15_07495 [Fundicoccus culcitae]
MNDPVNIFNLFTAFNLGITTPAIHRNLKLNDKLRESVEMTNKKVIYNEGFFLIFTFLKNNKAPKRYDISV